MIRDNQSLEDLIAERIAEKAADRLWKKILNKLNQHNSENEVLAALKEQKYLTVTEAAKLARKSRTTIYQAIYSGHLEAVQEGERYQIRPEALDEWKGKGAPKE